MSRKSRHGRKRIFIPPGVKILKSTGTFERFSPTKIQRSLIRCGTPPVEAKEIAQAVRTIHPRTPRGLSTDEIRRFVLNRLRGAHPAAATRYQLSRSIIKLGPSGFPFEKLVSRLYESEDYTTEINATLPGFCVNHEIDVIAQKNGKKSFIECKFHHTPGAVCDLKTALYVKARSDDLNRSGHPVSHHDEFVLLTNTRFSTEAQIYGECAGLKLVSWTYPVGTSLSHRLEISGLIPVTALTTIPRQLSEMMMGEGVITVKDLVERTSAWKMLGRDPKRLESIQREIDQLFDLVAA